MYIVGFLKLDHPRVLINPVFCSTIDELFNQLQIILDAEDFRQEPLITKEGLENALGSHLPLRVNFTGYHVALLLGSNEVINSATDRFINANLNIK